MDGALFQKLKTLRKRLTNEARVPAFIIFSDHALTDMASRLPQNEQQFLAVHGVGRLKMANYGKQFLALISEHCGGCSPADDAAVAPEALTIRRLPGARTQQIAEAFARNQRLDQTAAELGIKRSTVLHHLCKHVKTGGQLDPRAIAAESTSAAADRERVFDTFQQLGIDRLGPVYDTLGGTVHYDELHLLRLLWMF